MKIPKMFIPKKSLEDKTKDLLEKRPSNKCNNWGKRFYEELKDKFPNFADYLISLYPDVEICKIKNIQSIPPYSDDDAEWQFYIDSLPPNVKVQVGVIKGYIRESGIDTSEYGYEAEISTNAGKRKLIYRKGYHVFDSVNVIITTNDPLRRDKNKEIPFP